MNSILQRQSRSRSKRPDSVGKEGLLHQLQGSGDGPGQEPDRIIDSDRVRERFAVWVWRPGFIARLLLAGGDVMLLGPDRCAFSLSPERKFVAPIVTLLEK